MLPAALYSTIYYIVVTILTIFAVSSYQSAKDVSDTGSNDKNLLGYILPVLMSLFIGFRPISGRFVDMFNYSQVYHYLIYGHPFNLDLESENFIFDNLFNWLGANYYSITVFFVIMSFCYFMFAYRACELLFKSQAFLAFVVFLGAFSTFSYATNGIKAGAAASFFLCALGYRNSIPKAALFLLLSLGFHHSMIMPVVAYIAAFFVRNTKYYFGFWVFSLLIALLHISFFQELFAGMADERGSLYLNNTFGNWGGKTGFRFDFVLYSALPVVIGYFAIFVYKLKSTTYSFLFNVYLLTNAVWMLCMYAAFTNRIAYLSWFMYPVVTIYPFFCPQFMPAQKKRLKQVVWLQLLFTLFMDVIYYG